MNRIVSRIDWAKFPLSLFCLLFSVLAYAQNEPYLYLSHQEGAFQHGFYLEAEIPSGTELRFTINGSPPRLESAKYKGAIPVFETTFVRFALYEKDSNQRLLTKEAVYLKKEENSLLSVHLGIDPYILFDPQKGIFQLGPNAGADRLKKGANFWSKKDYETRVSIFDEQGKVLFSDDIGLRIFGGVSRQFTQKSLALIADKDFGASRIKYPFFEEKDLPEFKHLVLRNSGSDFGKSHLRDALFTHLTRTTNILSQASRPCRVFINGKYWGLYNLREKINKHFIQANTGIDKDQIDLIEHERGVKEGSIDAYQKMLDFIRDNDLKEKENYLALGEQMDLENYATYMAIQVFIDNQDAGGNIRFWRERKQGAKWNWILYDTDWGMGLHDPKAVTNNSLAFHTASDGPSWPNPPWSTLLLRSLLENDDFKRLFVNRLLDMGNIVFEADRVAEKIDSMQSLIKEEIIRHSKRWDLSVDFQALHIRRIKDFVKRRPAILHSYIQEQFGSKTKFSISLKAGAGGKVLLNNIPLMGPLLSGDYYKEIPILIEAIPREGYVFSHFEGLDNTKGSKVVLIAKNEVYAIEAVFKKLEKYDRSAKLVFVEGSASNKKTGDWLRLKNVGETSISLEGFYLNDGNKSHYFPAITLEGGEELVLAAKKKDFHIAFGKEKSVLELKLKLDKQHDFIQLRDPNRKIVDQIFYDLDLKKNTPFTLVRRKDGWVAKEGTGFGEEYVNYIKDKDRDKEKWLLSSTSFWKYAGGLCVFLFVLSYIFGREKKRIEEEE